VWAGVSEFAVIKSRSRSNVNLKNKMRVHHLKNETKISGVRTSLFALKKNVLM